MSTPSETTRLLHDSVRTMNQTRNLATLTEEELENQRKILIDSESYVIL